MSGLTQSQTIKELARFLRPILESDSVHILYDVAAQAERSIQQPTGRRARRAASEWSYEIPPAKPLRFRPCEYRRLRLRPDIFCKLAGPGDDGLPVKTQNIVLRVWSLEDRFNYRHEWDSEAIQNRIGQNSMNERVVLRCHFDKAEKSKSEPIFHLQFGGKALKEELFWLPKSISAPRLPFFPLDIVLVCEIIISNFYPRRFEELNRDPEWIALVATSQERFCQSYYDKCKSKCSKRSVQRSGKTLLASLCNTLVV